MKPLPRSPMPIRFRLPALAVLLTLLLAACGAKPALPVSFRTAPASSSSSAAGGESGQSIDFTNEGMPKTIDSLEVGTLSGASAVVTLESGAVLIGSAAAPVLTVYTDYACDYCREFTTDHRPDVERRYVDDGEVGLRLVFLPRDAAGTLMAKTALCAAKQNRLKEADDLLTAHPIAKEGELPAFAKKAGLGLAALRACVASAGVDRDVRSAAAEAASAGVERVPAFSLNGHSWLGLMEGDELLRTIGEALSR